MIVLKHLGSGRNGAEVLERQRQKSDAGLCPESLALIIQAKPRRGCDLPYDHEVARPESHRAQWLALPENAESETPGIDTPSGELVPVVAKDNTRTLLWSAVGPGGEERALVRAMNPPCGNLGQGREILLTR